MSESTSSGVYGVDYEPVDSEHRVQIGLMDALCKALEQEPAEGAIDGILERLVSYTDAHFMAEQLLMRQYSYPMYEAHELEHDRLVEKVHELQRKYRAGEILMTLEVAQSLKAWLLRHIKSTDHALGDFLKQHGEPNPG